MPEAPELVVKESKEDTLTKDKLQQFECLQSLNQSNSNKIQLQKNHMKEMALKTIMQSRGQKNHARKMRAFYKLKDNMTRLNEIDRGH